MPVQPDAAIEFIGNLRNTKGRFAGSNFHVYEFQARVLREILKTHPKTGKRMLREFLLGVARKNGKTELIAALAIVLLVLDDEPGGEVVVAAGKRDQAKILLSAAKKMVRISTVKGRPLTDFLQIRRDSIYFPELDATLKAVSADAQNEQGLNPHAAIVDELHVAAEKNRDLYDALYTGQDARENPIIVSLTTAGPIPAGPCHDFYRYGKEIESGIRSDPNFGMIWHEAPPGADVDDPAAMRAANPALGLFLPEENLKKKALDVMNGKMSEYSFRRLHFNNWTTSVERWLPYRKWIACGDLPEIPENAEVYMALDAALRRDTFGVAWLWLEEDAVMAPRESDGLIVPMSVAHVKVKRFVPMKEGDYIDPSEVETFVLGLHAQHPAIQVSYDPAYMGLLASSLAERGLPMEPFPQTAAKMERATETLQRVVIDSRLRHGNDPILNDQMAAVGTKPTERGVRISKVKSGLPIDVVSALAMALDDALGEEMEPQDFAVSI